MGMTRRDYLSLSETMAKTRPPESDFGRRQQWGVDVCALADMLANQNRRFERGRFIADCQGEPCSEKP